jgi:hypothetical protein
MTVTAIQIGLDPDMVDYSSSDFAQFPGLSKEGLRGANDDSDAGADKARQWLEAKRWYPNPEAVA